jgi:hypothetical protein
MWFFEVCSSSTKRQIPVVPDLFFQLDGVSNGLDYVDELTT